MTKAKKRSSRKRMSNRASNRAVFQYQVAMAVPSIRQIKARLNREAKDEKAAA